MAAVSLFDIAGLTQVVPDRTSVWPGGLVHARLALPLPGDSLALGDSAFRLDVHWRATTVDPMADSQGFVIPPAAVRVLSGTTLNVPNYPAGVGTIMLQLGDEARLPSAAPFFLIWWNRTDYTDPHNDPFAEIVLVTATAANTLTITRGQRGTDDVAHDIPGKTYVMGFAPLGLASVNIVTGSTGGIRNYPAGVSTVTLQPNHVTRLPSVPPFFLIWWNSSFSNPDADPNAEIVQVINISGNDLTIKRGQRRTRDVDHNNAGVTYMMRPAPLVLGLDFIAPMGVDQLTPAFGLMPPIQPSPSPTYWLIAEFSLRRAALPAGLPLEPLTLFAAKASPPILAQGLTAADLEERLLGLFKIEIPTAVVAPGAPLTARLRPRGAEDSEWDVESASEVSPKIELAAKVQLAPLARIIGAVSDVSKMANEIQAGGVRLLSPLVRTFVVLARAVSDIAEKFTEGVIQHLSRTLTGYPRPKDPLSGVNVDSDLDRVLGRLPDQQLFNSQEELPIDVDLANTSFTTNLVPRDSVPPLPGPRGLRPTIPSLEQQLELTDQLPSAISAIPVVGSLHIPLSIKSVAWELWRPDVSVVAGGISQATRTITLVPGDVANLPSQTPFWLIIWDSTDLPDPGGTTEIVRVDGKGISGVDTLSVTRGQRGTAPVNHPAGRDYKMRLVPFARLMPGPAGEQKVILDAPSMAEVRVPNPFMAADGPPIDYEGPTLPTATPFWLIWWSDPFAHPHEDPNAEIIKVTGHNARSKRLLTLARGQYGTAPADHLPRSKMRIAPVPSAVTVAQRYGAGAREIRLARGDAERLPSPPFDVIWWNTTDYSEPAADASVEVVQVTSVDTTNRRIFVTRGRYGTTAVPHDLGNKTYRMHLAADYFEIDLTAARSLKRTFAIEPPSEPGALVNLRVRLDILIDPANARPSQLVKLPTLPIRLAGFNPLAFIAQQLTLTAHGDRVEPGEETLVQLASAIPLESGAPSAMLAPLTLRELPIRNPMISVAWEVLDDNGEPLAEGTDYAITGATATARSILFVPSLQIMRREDPASSHRYVRVRLVDGVTRSEQIVGPLPLAILPLQLPAFVAMLQYRLFMDTREDTALVLLPDMYVTQAPKWVESWETFKTRLNELERRVSRLLAVAGGTLTAPLADGAAQQFPTIAVQRLTLLRGVLDYVANRPATGKLAFMSSYRGWFATGAYTGYWRPQDLFDNAETIIVVNDDVAEITVLAVDGAGISDITIDCTPTRPICVLWIDRFYGTPNWPAWVRVEWIPAERGEWSALESIQVNGIPEYIFQIHAVRLASNQGLAINRYFPSPASLWSLSD